MKTVTIQIGNSDDKLSQGQWADYSQKVANSIGAYAEEIHFSGFSVGDAPWQNAAWVIVIDNEYLQEERLRNELTIFRKEFKQDSIAWTEGETKFI